MMEGVLWSGLGLLWFVVGASFGAAIQRAACDKKVTDQQLETHDDLTLFRVREALLRAHLTTGDAEAAVTEMQNAGILFRERAKRE